MDTYRSAEKKDRGDALTGWRPTLGSWPELEGVRFRVWSPRSTSVDVVLERPDRSIDPILVPLKRYPDGTWGVLVPDIGPGTWYRYRVDGGMTLPDPASRFQPEGVHGPSEVIDPWQFAWTDQDWHGVARADLVLYELHVGTFTPEGTFDGVIGRLPYLAELGVTAIELMPLGDFPGDRNWGYDGVDLYAPARCYGRPDDLRRLVNEAHRQGIAVFLDVVYNHLGPEGNYLSAYSKSYFSETHTNPWGQSLNFDGTDSSMVRQFFIENALHWVHEYHIDGLRLDATHAIVDDNPRHFVTELATRVRESTGEHPVYVIAEDHRNLAHMIRPECEGGWGLDGVWADDFHHSVRVALAGDNEGYYKDFTGSMPDLARTLNMGWHYTGQYSEYLKEHRGTDATEIPSRRFVFCLQNHDQIGNRAHGERLHHQIDLPAYRAASVLLLSGPATPLLFMGQEWAATSPFLYFTDHPEELGRLVTEGRRNEFQHFSAFSDPNVRDQIPDPQAESTFAASRLRWDETQSEPGVSMRRLYQRLLALRQAEPAIRSGRFEAFALGETTLMLRLEVDRGPSMVVVIQMNGEAEVNLAGHPGLSQLEMGRCRIVLTTEDRPFAVDPMPPEIRFGADGPAIRFARPSTVILSAWKRTADMA